MLKNYDKAFYNEICAIFALLIHAKSKFIHTTTVKFINDSLSFLFNIT